LVAGKLAALVTYFLFLLFTSVPLVLLVLPFGDFDLGPIGTQYLGSFLLGISGLSLGQFVSSKTSNQISAFLIASSSLLVFTLADSLGRIVSGSWFQRLMNQFSFQFRYGPFVRGIIDTRDLSFFLLITLVFYYLTVRSIDKEKWS